MSKLPHGREGKENEQNIGKGQADSILLIQRPITTTPTDLKPEIC